MRVKRRPYLFLIGWTVVALLPMALLWSAMSAPISDGCFEWCDLGQQFSGRGFLLVGVVWLFAVLELAWTWRDSEPTIAAVSAFVAGLLFLVVAARLFDVVSSDVLTGNLLQLSWVVGLGLQLPPMWRLTKRSPPSIPLRVVVGIMSVAVAVAAISVVLLGTNVAWSTGPTVVVLAWMVGVVGVTIATLAAWRDGVAQTWLVGPLLVASLPILLFPVGVVAPGDIGYVIFLALPLSAVAWLWIAVAWLRGRLSLAAETAA